MGKLVGLGCGAGLVSALIFGLIATGAPAAILLCYLAPLPIAIVSLGWNHRLGLLAAFSGAVAIAIAVRSSAGIAFVIGPALPAWWISCLVLTGRAVGGRNGGGVAWLPMGHVLLAIGASGAFVAVAAAIGLGNGDAAHFHGILRRVTEGLLRVELDMPREGPLSTVAGVPGASFVSVLVAIAPAIAGAAFGLALALNLWLAAKSVSLSGRLPRAWPATPEMRMPVSALVALAAGAALAFLPGWPGIVGRALAGGLGMMFALQGLALLHVATRGRPARGALLALAYVLTIFFGGTVLPLMAVAGMVDTATPLRRRLARNPTHPPRSL